MEAGWEWVVSLDALQAIECRMLDEPGIQHQIAVDVDAAKRRNRIEKAVKEATSEGAVQQKASRRRLVNDIEPSHDRLDIRLILHCKQ